MPSRILLSSFVLSLGVASSAAVAQAQSTTSSRDQAPPVPRTDRPAAGAPSTATPSTTPTDDAARTLLGITVVTTGSERDTLGLLISGIVAGSPADRAGIDAGSRLTEVNGVSLRVALDVAGDEGAAQRRLTRVLRAVSPGDDVSLRLFRGGRFRDVTVQAASTGPTATEPAPKAVTPPLVGPLSATAAAATAPVTLAKVSEATAQAQALLRRLVAQEEEAEGPLLDTLVQLQAQLADVQRRLRAAQAPAPTPSRVARVPAAAAAVEDDDPASGGDALAGLRVEAVADDLAPFYGEGSEGGLIVLHAEATWAPLRAGDVITSINNQPPTMARLRAVAQGTRAGRLEVLRKRRLIAITVQPE